MNQIKDKILNHVKDKKELIQSKLIERVESVKMDLKKKFTIASLLVIGGLMIIQGFIRFLPGVLMVPEYFVFFFVGGIFLLIGILYYWKSWRE